MKHLSNTVSRSVLHKFQRYDTAGDYMAIGRDDLYYISKNPLGWRAELAVLIHEMIEFNLCKEAGIKEKDITKFDIESGLSDPGASKAAPYYEQHKIATKIEKQVVKALGLSWEEYDQSFNELKY
jgi:hypothetical protein